MIISLKNINYHGTPLNKSAKKLRLILLHNDKVYYSCTCRSGMAGITIVSTWNHK